jgi:thiol-disulfide isomerase/thioredoxin
MVRRVLRGITTPVVLAALLVAPMLCAQTQPISIAPGLPGSDALPFLTELFARYDHATTYHLEYTEEQQLTGAYMRNWSKNTNIVVVGPSNQYRLEHHGQFGDALQVSDGKTEWVYSPNLGQYTQQPTPSDGPSKVRAAASIGLQQLSGARSVVHSIGHLSESIHAAKFAADQELQIGDKTIFCIVVITEGALPVKEAHIAVTSTFWVEKQSGLIRRYVSRRDGELLPAEPGFQLIGETERVYTIAALSPVSFPDGTFTFTPPPYAVLVQHFLDKQGQELAQHIGKTVSGITLKDSNGKGVLLQSFQGKPVLLDFWATWCVPCRESLPTLQKLYAEYKDKGLVLLSLDEDQEPQKAADYWAQNKFPWSNYHLDKLSAEKFPPHGIIPYFLLLDASGNIVFSQAGSEEEELRSAVASLDWSAKTAPPTIH